MDSKLPWLELKGHIDVSPKVVVEHNMQAMWVALLQEERMKKSN